MRVARIETDAGVEYAVGGDDGGWVPSSRLGRSTRDLPELIEAWPELEKATRAHTGIEIPQSALRNPVVRPPKMLAIGLNYADHAKETGAKAPERPVVFAKYTNSLNDPFADVEIPRHVTEQADYESELAVIIGRRCRGVTRDEALEYVFGYAVANDVSARDWQRSDAQFSRSKSADTFCPIGPWITTADEVADPGRLAIRSVVNGEVRQDSSTRYMIFDVPELIRFLSATITLEPGDVLLTGTPPGVGLGFTPPRFLRPGDVVECAIDGLGAIRNVFVDAPAVGRGRGDC